MRRFKTARPARVLIRFRNPCTRILRRFFGWYVLFGILVPWFSCLGFREGRGAR
jgi:hypothetical protein